MKLAIGVILFASLTARSFAATCSYYRSSNQITCGSTTCNTVANVGGGKVPPGYYIIGTFVQAGDPVPRFNLYKEKSGGPGEFWDYHTQIPEENCRGEFGLHPGTTSVGSITVTSNGCFKSIKQVIATIPAMQFPITECIGCGGGTCVSTNRINAPRIADLQVYQ